MTIVTVGKTETTRDVIDEIERQYSEEIRIIRRDARAHELDRQMRNGHRSVSMLQYMADKAHCDFLEKKIRTRNEATK